MPNEVAGPEEEDLFAEGYFVAMSNGRISDCRFALHTPECNVWILGYHQALCDMGVIERIIN